jgi:UDP-glucose 4-epimerase
MKPEILLLGGAGFLGRRLARECQAHGWRVGVLDRVPIGDEDVAATQFIGELRDTHLLRTALKDFKRIVFLAHESRVAPANDRLPANFLNNIELFSLLLEECREAEVRDIILFSTGGAVYGEAEGIPMPENHPQNPCSLYGVAKLTMEKCLAVFATQTSCRHLIVRPSNPYGPGQNFNGPQGLIAVAMARIARGQEVTIRGNGRAVKDYLFIDDFAEAFQKLVADPEAQGAFNIGSGQATDVRQVIAHIEAILGKKAVLRFEPDQPGDVSRNVLDIAKICNLTGWSPRTQLPQGIQVTWDWMRGRI